MKWDRLLIFTALLGGSAHSAAASESCEQYSTDWEKCQTDSDCRLDQTACYATAAYNKQSLSRVRAYNQCLRPKIKCAPPKDDNGKTLAVCRDGKCVAMRPSELGIGSK